MKRTAASLLLLAITGTPMATAEGPRAQTLEIYRQKCQVCHKADGTGMGKEMNLTDTVWIHGSSAAAISKVISEGVKGKAMMSYGKQLSAEEIDGLARYVRSFDKSLMPQAKR
jgi:mono/diheme cytochrome c family protein